MSSFEDVIAKLDLLSKTMATNTPHTAVEKGAFAAKASILAALTAKVPSHRLRNIGKNGSALSVSYAVSAGADPTALVHANGPWQIVESDTRPHVIIAKSIGRSKSRTKVARHASKQQLYTALFGGTDGGYSGAGPLATPYGPRFRVNHPGTKGKHPWVDGVAASKITVPIAMSAVGLADMRAIFK